MITVKIYSEKQKWRCTPISLIGVHLHLTLYIICIKKSIDFKKNLIFYLFFD